MRAMVKDESAWSFLSPSSQLGLQYPHLSDPKLIFLPQTSIVIITIVLDPVIDWLDTDVICVAQHNDTM